MKVWRAVAEDYVRVETVTPYYVTITLYDSVKGEHGVYGPAISTQQADAIAREICADNRLVGTMSSNESTPTWTTRVYRAPGLN